MAESDLLMALSKLVARHETLVSILSKCFFDVVQVMWPNVKKCSSDGCTSPATVRHVHLDVSLCDYHCASAICNAGRNFINAEPDDPLNDVRGTILREEDWVDAEDADSIRRLACYVQIVKDAPQSAIH